MVIILFYHTDKGKSIKKRFMKKTLNFKEKTPAKPVFFRR